MFVNYVSCRLTHKASFKDMYVGRLWCKLCILPTRKKKHQRTFMGIIIKFFWQPHPCPSARASLLKAYPIWKPPPAENYKLQIFLIRNFAANTKLQTLIKFPLIFFLHVSASAEIWFSLVSPSSSPANRRKQKQKLLRKNFPLPIYVSLAKIHNVSNIFTAQSKRNYLSFASMEW